MATAHAPKVSEADYLASENAAETRHEFVNGELVAMAGGTPAHAHVIGEVYAALRGKLGASGCVPTTGDQRIHVPATGLYAWPDVSVFCGRPERHPTDPNTLVNPALIVEVLSPSTEAYDRGAKFAHYRTIPTLRAFLLVSPEARTLEAFERRPDGAWTIPAPVGPGGALLLETFGIELTADELFGQVERFLDAG